LEVVVNSGLTELVYNDHHFWVPIKIYYIQYILNNYCLSITAYFFVYVLFIFSMFRCTKDRFNMTVNTMDD